MQKLKSSSEWKKLLKETKVFIRREGSVLFIWGALLVGALSFLAIVDSGWGVLPNWSELVIAVVIATLALPETFRALKNNEEPLLVRFSLAFRAGFLSISQLAPSLGEWRKRLVEYQSNQSNGIKEQLTRASRKGALLFDSARKEER